MGMVNDPVAPTLPTAEPPVAFTRQAAGPAEVTDMMGNRVGGADKAGDLRIEATREPRYVLIQLGAQ